MTEDQEKDNSTEEVASETNPETSSNASAANAELEKLKSDYLYLKADFENYKKRAVKERADLLKYGGEYAFVGILAILDNFERALQAKADDNSLASFKKGVELISKDFKNVLQQFGITEVNSLGQKFDPFLNEAIGSIASDEISEGHVVQVLRSPYKFHDKIIRTGQVIVSLGKKSKEDS